MSDNTYKMFNGASNYAGYIQSWRGGKASIRVIRANKNETLDDAIKRVQNEDEAEITANEGFMVNQYQVQFQRTVQNQYFLNVEGAVAILGRGQGTVTLTGLVGSAQAMADLVGASEKGDTGSETDDFCRPLCIMISGTTQMNDCKNGSEYKGTTLLCGNVVIQTFSVNGQTQADGAEMQVASLSGTFTRLDIKANAKKK